QNSLKKNAIVSLAIKRPMTPETLNKVAAVINDDTNDPEMQIDAILIGRNEACKRHMNLRNKPKNKILVKRSSSTKHTAMCLEKNVTEDIHSEVNSKDWDDLQAVPPRLDFSSLSSSGNNQKSSGLKKRFKVLMDTFF
uniref:Product n=3 Tax=Bursaphelenchus xylophilus TaxID=6326 RepID=A0A1I7SNA7_BURXY